jgi:hypothetical protein
LAKIPTEFERLSAANRAAAASAASASAPAPASARVANVQLLTSPSAKWTAPLSAGTLVASRYLDSPLKGQNMSVPPEITQRATQGSGVQLALEVNESGKVTGGQVQSGDGGIGQEIISAAKAGWQFTAPRCNGKPVITKATVKVLF